jgi:hypothetical protein
MEDFAAFLDDCMAELKDIQEANGEKWGIDDAERWDVDQDRGTIEFRNTRTGHQRMVGRVQIIGSFDTQDDTWLWAWANPTVRDALRQDALKLRQYGEEKGLEQLTEAKWEGEERDGWQMTALAVKLLGAEGAYRGPAGRLLIFMVFRDLKPVGEKWLRDDVLGDLEWNERWGEWEGHAEVCEWRVQLEVSPLPEQEPAAVLAAARDSLAWVRQHEAEARQSVAASFLEEVNQFWNEGPNYSAEDFAGILELVTLQLRGDGTMALLYDNDEGLFKDRWVVAQLDPERRLVKTELQK